MKRTNKFPNFQWKGITEKLDPGFTVTPLFLLELGHLSHSLFISGCSRTDIQVKLKRHLSHRMFFTFQPQLKFTPEIERSSSILSHSSICVATVKKQVARSSKEFDHLRPEPPWCFEWRSLNIAGQTFSHNSKSANGRKLVAHPLTKPPCYCIVPVFSSQLFSISNERSSLSPKAKNHKRISTMLTGRRFPYMFGRPWKCYSVTSFWTLMKRLLQNDVNITWSKLFSWRKRNCKTTFRYVRIFSIIFFYFSFGLEISPWSVLLQLLRR